MAIKTARPPGITPNDDDEVAFEGLPKSTTAHQELVQAFEQSDAERQRKIDNHPVMKFLAIHDKLETDDNRPIAGVNDATITLGELKKLVDMLR